MRISIGWLTPFLILKTYKPNYNEKNNYFNAFVHDSVDGDAVNNCVG